MKFSPVTRWKWVTRADLSMIPQGSRDTCRRVLGIIAEHADQQKLIARVGIDTIASELQVTPRTIKRSLPMLEQAGLILVKHIRRAGNMYMLLMGEIDSATAEHWRARSRMAGMVEEIGDVYK